MKVTSVETIPIGVPLAPPGEASNHPLGIPNLPHVLVRVRTDEGHEGWGEISDGWGYEYPAVAAAIVDEALSRFVVGRDPRDVATLVERIWAWMRRRQGTTWLVAQAVSGVEIALWDLVSRADGTPVSESIGSPVHTRIPIYAGGNFLGQGDAATHAEFYRPALERGVDMIKVRIGVDWERDLDVLGELHELLGAEVQIGVDGSEAYRADTSLLIAHRMAELDVAFFEEPTPRDDASALALLVAESPVPIAYGEHVHRASGFRTLEEDGPLSDIWQPDVTVLGGYIEATAAYALAADLGRPISPHSATTPLGFAANLHGAATAPTLSYVEYSATAIARLASFFDGGEQLSLDAVEDGKLALPTGPGIGVTPNVEALQEAFPVRPLSPVDDMPPFYIGAV